MVSGHGTVTTRERPDPAANGPLIDADPASMTVTRRAVLLVLGTLVAAAGAAVALVFALAEPDSPCQNPAESAPCVGKSGAWISTDTSDTFALNGTVSIPATGSRGYDDIHTGAQVEVTNGAGEVLAVGTLGEPSLIGRADTTDVTREVYSFSIGDVPLGEKMYGVHVGNANRGVIWKNETEAQQGFELTIG